MVSSDFVNVGNFFLIIVSEAMDAMDGPTEKSWVNLGQMHVYFELREYQPFRVMIPIMIWYKNPRVVFNFFHPVNFSVQLDDC